MPSYKNAERNTWYCAFYFTDWQGKRKKKKKEGFKTKREAQEWERKFLEQYADTPDISFEVLVKAYQEHQQIKTRKTSFHTDNQIIHKHILPYFGDMSINKISRQTILTWKKIILEKNYQPSYSKYLYTALKKIFNYAVENYNLPSNPCPPRESFGEINKHIDYWTIDEFRKFAMCLKKPVHIMAFYMLFWTGMRCGELLALTWDDIDFDNNAIHISKTFTRLHGENIITPGKTSSSKRIVIMPNFLADMLKDFKRMSLFTGDRIFDISKGMLSSKFKTAINKSGVKRIRIHDLRHSHASLLINAGFQPIDVADRLGHSNASITLNIYSHFYDSKRTALAKKLNTIV